MAQGNTYALYASGNFIQETELDRLGGWIAPDVLSGKLIFENPFLVFHDDLALRVDASRSWYVVDGGYVLGRDLAAPNGDWRVGYLRLVTDGTEADALRWIEEIEDGTELDRLDQTGLDDPLGEIVAAWEDPHGQWDLALVAQPN
ncbi:hypothetical protein AB0H71_10530 [Nocardia sp. NPDC050697]|uniref:hypothetical protein n=1 Tax=Nocardia sp. NPDC050697 TaxID=3155158 RepID=UPI0033F5E9B8